jgi:putative oxidoreductase
MEKWLGKYSDFFYALMRFVAGVLFACHGAQKLFGVLGSPKQEATLYIVAGVIELVGGILIAVGFLTSRGLHFKRRDGGGLLQATRARRHVAYCE